MVLIKFCKINVVIYERKLIFICDCRWIVDFYEFSVFLFLCNEF